MEKLWFIFPLIPIFYVLVFFQYLFSKLNGRPFLDTAAFIDTVNKLSYAFTDLLVSTLQGLL